MLLDDFESLGSHRGIGEEPWVRAATRGYPNRIEPVPLVPAQSSLMGAAAIFSIASVFLGATVVLGFDWALADVIGGAVIGIVLWGVLTYLTDVHNEVPEADDLPLAPIDAEIRRTRRLRPRVLGLIPLCIAMAWLANRWDLGGAFVPGQFAGYASANLLGAVLVGRWQREHGGEVLVRYDGVDEPELYLSRSLTTGRVK